MVTLGRYEDYAKWRGTTWNQRGEGYEEHKQKITEQMLEALYKQMPQLRGTVDYAELSTPLSTEWFQLNDRGEIYGLEHDPDRFRQDWLHPITPVKGLYMTGQDIVTCGIGGAFSGQPLEEFTEFAHLTHQGEDQPGKEMKWMSDSTPEVI